MKIDLIKLSNELDSAGYHKASTSILLVIASAGEIESWQLVLDEIQKPEPKQAFDRAIGYMIDGISELNKAASSLSSYSDEEVLQAIQIGHAIPGAVKSSEIDFNAIKKFSKRFSELEKRAQEGWFKSIKGLGAGSLKLIPIIGVAFSGLLALKNLYYGFIEYKKLISESEQVGLTWSDTLFVNKIKQKINQKKDSPEDLSVLVRVCKSAKVFLDEGISFAANSIDFIKDFIFLLIEGVVAAGSTIIPPGWGATLGIGAIDISISLLIWIIESSSEQSSKKSYDILIEDIRETAEQKIENLRKAKYKDWDDEKLWKFFQRKSLTNSEPKAPNG